MGGRVFGSSCDLYGSRRVPARTAATRRGSLRTPRMRSGRATAVQFPSSSLAVRVSLESLTNRPSRTGAATLVRCSPTVSARLVTSRTSLLLTNSGRAMSGSSRNLVPDSCCAPGTRWIAVGAMDSSRRKPGERAEGKEAVDEVAHAVSRTAAPAPRSQSEADFAHSVASATRCRFAMSPFPPTCRYRDSPLRYPLCSS